MQQYSKYVNFEIYDIYDNSERCFTQCSQCACPLPPSSLAPLIALTVNGKWHLPFLTA